MNFIQAWKEATEKGATGIRRAVWKTEYNHFEVSGEIESVVKILSSMALLADDWYVVVPKIKREVRGELLDKSSTITSCVRCRLVHFDIDVPDDATITATWEE